MLVYRDGGCQRTASQPPARPAPAAGPAIDVPAAGDFAACPALGVDAPAGDAVRARAALGCSDDTRDFLRALLVVTGLTTWVAFTLGAMLFTLVQ